MRRMIWRRSLIVVIIVAFVCALVIMREPPPEKHPPNDDPWVLVSYKPDARYGTYLGNGFISTRIKGDGVGSQDGKPLPCFMAGLYDNEKLIATPTWSDLRFYDGKTPFKIDPNAPYKQSLDMRTGVLTTRATWRAGGKTLKGKIEVIVSRAQRNVALIYAEIVPSFEGRLRAESAISNIDSQLQPPPAPNRLSDWWESVPTELGPRLALFGGLWRASFVTQQSGLTLGMVTTMGLASRPGSNSQAGRRQRGPGDAVEIDAKPGQRVVILRYAALALGHDRSSVLAECESRLNEAMRIRLYKTPRSWDDVEEARALRETIWQAHVGAWVRLWMRRIILDGPRKDQQVLNSCMFYILESVREGSEWSIPPMGLSDNAFSGHVFWDADLWIFPALILQHPQLAKSIVEYRYKTLPGAIANAKASGNAGAEYAWESGYTGKEDTAPGLPYRYERHINGDVALAQWQYYLATGDLNWLKTRGYPVIKATADYWTTRATFVPAKNRCEILRVVPPDENAEIVNNSAYTNCIAQLNLRIAQEAAKLVGAKPNPKWAVVADKMYIPFDRTRGIFTAHDNYKGYEAKQADTELVIYPLQYQLPGVDMNSIYRKVFSFYAPKVMPHGPAMSASVHSVMSARLDDPHRAYEYFLKSYKPYLRGPFNYFNEKPSKIMDSMCFLTGAAGPIQALLFGTAGIRMEYLGPNAGKLSYSPRLPKQWKSLNITGVQWRGRTLDIVAKPR